MSVAAQALEAWERRWQHEELETAIADLDGALEELIELAKGNKHPGTEAALEVEVESESDRALRALAVIERFAEGQRP